MKGLGTSTNQEGKEYFSDLGKHRKDFVWVDGEDDDPIKLAFSKKKIEPSSSGRWKIMKVHQMTFDTHSLGAFY
ncbi:hypothetical protein ACS0TY_002550 [Phlomoides rotata]